MKQFENQTANSKKKAVQFSGLFALCFLIFDLAVPAHGAVSDVYITPDGNSQGICTSNPQTPAWFNDPNNWGTNAGQIGPGTTVHLCGKFDFPAGATALNIQGSGTSGSPITIKFESGAIMQSPAFAGGGTSWNPGSAIFILRQNYIVIDGQGSGIIQNLADGTPGQTTCLSGVCSIDQATIGVGIVEGNNIEVKGLTIRNMYMEKGSVAGGGGADVNEEGGSNISVHDCTLTNAGQGVAMDYSYFSISNVSVYNNYLADHFWDVGVGGGFYTLPDGSMSHNSASNILIYNNEFTDWSNWNGNFYTYHTDGVQAYVTYPGSMDVTIYNNYFHGSIDGGGGGTAYIWCSVINCVYGSGNCPAAPVPLPSETCKAFNNVFDPGPTGAASWNVANAIYGAEWYNNTVLGNSDGHGRQGTGFVTLGLNADYRNNILTNYYQMYDDIYTALLPAVATSDHNVLFNCTEGQNGIGNPNACFQGGGSWSMAQWQALGYDAHSTTSDPLLNSSTYKLQLGSPAIGLGANLTSMCQGQPNPGMGALCYDKPATVGVGAPALGNPRPATGPWDAGAFTYTGNRTTPPTTPTGLIVTGTSSSTVSLAWSPSSPKSAAVSGYKIYRNGNVAGSTSNTFFTDPSLLASTLYTYTVTAYDALANESAPSSSVSAATTLSGTNGPIARLGEVRSVASQNPSATFTLPSDVPAGSGILVFTTFPDEGTNGSDAVVTDSKGNTYQSDVHLFNGTSVAEGEINSGYVATALKAGDTITVTIPNSGYTDFNAIFYRLTSMASSNWTDTKASFNNPYYTIWQTGTTGVTTQPNEIVFAGFAIHANETVQWSPGYTGLDNESATNGAVTGWTETTLTGAQSATITASVAAAVPAMIAVYKLGNSGIIGSDIYITPDGNPSGVCTTNVQTPAFFNNPANWSTGTVTGLIGPGTTVHLCGTFTGTITSSILMVQGSGTVGAPITIKWEPGAVLTSPVCGGNGCLDTMHNTYLILDGNGNQPTITATDNGTQLGHQMDSAGINASYCNGCEIKNQNITNIYVFVGPDDPNEMGGGIGITGSSNIKVHDNTFDQMAIAIWDSFGNGDNNLYIYNNTYDHFNHGIEIGQNNSNVISNVYIYGNHGKNMANWDTTNDYHHHNAIFFFQDTVIPNTIKNFYVYNNLFDGDRGVYATAWIYFNSGLNGIYVFNNILKGSGGGYLIEGGIPGDTNFFLYNNYLDCNGGAGINFGDVAGFTFENNVMNNCWTYLFTHGITNPTVDHNIYVAISTTSTNTFAWNKNFVDFAGYRAANPTLDVHAATATTTGADSNGAPLAGSAMIHDGVTNYQNLSSLCTGGLAPLCSDVTGVARPSSGSNNWDAGAYQYCTGSGCNPHIIVSLSPSAVTLPSGTTQQFTAIVTGNANTAVTWSAALGTISSLGLYTAPVVSANTLDTVTATSVADGSKSASATVTVTAGGGSPPPSPATPTLNLPAFLPINAQISANYSGSDPASYYSWSFTPVTSIGVPAYRSIGNTSLADTPTQAAAPSASFTTSSSQANLSTVQLALGPYLIGVQVFDSNGKSSTQAQATVTLVPADLSGVRVFPNPWRSDKHGGLSITFDNLTVNSTIKIFTVSGHWVKTLPKSSTSVTWDLTNDAGDKVASGLYVYLIKTDDGQKKTGQIGIIK